MGREPGMTKHGSIHPGPTNVDILGISCKLP